MNMRKSEHIDLRKKETLILRQREVTGKCVGVYMFEVTDLGNVCRVV